jgi:hypothetical protein
MKWVSMYMVGYALLILGVLGGLWKTGTLVRIGAAWTGIGLLVALGLGVMIAVSASGVKESIDIDQT